MIRTFLGRDGVLCLLLGLVFTAASAQAQYVERLSVDSIGGEASSGSSLGGISVDGRTVVFTTQSALVPQDQNSTVDVYVRDRAAGTLTLVSVAHDGADAGAHCLDAKISSNGRFVIFASTSNTLTPGDSDSNQDVFLVDREVGSIELVSIPPSGAEFTHAHSFGGVSDDGRYVVYLGEFSGPDFQVFIRDRLFGITSLVSKSTQGLLPNGLSQQPFITADGGRVFFKSWATDIVDSDDNGSESSIFVYETITKSNALVMGGSQPGHGFSLYAVSRNGSWLAFDTQDALLIDDPNSRRNVYRYELSSSQLDLVGGSRVGDSQTFGPSVSEDGQRVTFRTNEVWHPSDDNIGVQDVYVWDYDQAVALLVSSDVYGNAQDAPGGTSFISGSGEEVVFQAKASNLVPGDLNGVEDVFVHDLTPRPWLVGFLTPGSPLDIWTRHLVGRNSETCQVVLSCSGTAGIPVPGGFTLPLTFDVCTSLSLSLGVLLRGIVLDERATLTAPLVWPTVPAGQSLYFAGFTFSPGGVTSVTGVNQIVTP
ncbi:MAG: hypothetical protein RL885_04750 [Planctomycetota bacterium]